ncbi:hypothetical protein GH714_019843 [Hevea brasiliensis]|uniref:Cytochrome P450 n=1 Tax=Hevea brasiliensis TaxID=3981 RepID=A0A6A6K7X5_HEVBR|nr:hypothetical protein GH714_019843 [Hevea brasiliensis]
MGSVFGKRYDPARDAEELEELRDMVNEGFDLLSAFNWCDYLPWLNYFYDPFRIHERCLKLVPRVRKLVAGIIEDHRLNKSRRKCDSCDFVDVLLSLDGEEKLEEDDMVAVLWEMIFRGTDTTALLTEWIMAELVLHPEIQEKLQRELDGAAKDGNLTDSEVANLPYLKAVVKETLRVHPQAHSFRGPGCPRQTRRICPGKNLGLVTVTLWVAKLVHQFQWVQDLANPVDLSEVLRLSCEMKKPLQAVALQRTGVST